jgi:hypothetical protein
MWRQRTGDDVSLSCRHTARRGSQAHERGIGGGEPFHRHSGQAVLRRTDAGETGQVIGSQAHNLGTDGRITRRSTQDSGAIGGPPPEARAFQDHRAVYFIAVGGVGALLSKQIKAVEVVAYDDLGTEAIRRMEIDEFPVIVCNDIHGGDLLRDGKAQWRRHPVS